MSNENTPKLAVVEEPEEDIVVDDGRNSPYTHTVLEVWQNLLGNIDQERDLKITPQASIAMLASWPHLKVYEHEDFSQMYYWYLTGFMEVVEDVIDANPEALKRVETDAEENHDLYVEIIARWQKLSKAWEDAWDSNSDSAHITLAALADAINFALSSQGLVAQLDPVGFQLTEEDAVTMQEIIDEEK